MKNTVLTSQAILIGSFFLSFGVFKLLGGNVDTDWSNNKAAMIGAVLTIAAGLGAYIYMYIKRNNNVKV